MQLNRNQLIQAISFLKPAISKADEADARVSSLIKAFIHVHVKIEDRACTLTAADRYLGKRVVLFMPKQLSFDGEGPHIDQEFLIPRETFETFETLCRKHKAKFEKLSKTDHSLKTIDISPTSLESHTDTINYEQPQGLEFPDVNEFFYANASPATGITVDSAGVIASFKEFNGAVEVTFSGENGPVYLCNSDKTYQAFFIPLCQGKSE